MVDIQLNGEARQVPEGLTLRALLDWLQLPADRVAVERNLEIVPRSQWGETTIGDGDRLEVVHLVGGGVDGLVKIQDLESPRCISASAARQGRFS